MAEVRESIDVNVPVSTAYNQWTQFEEFPAFMEGVQSVTQIDDTHLRWVAEVGGKTHEWEAEIVQQVPDKLIGWRSVDGKGVDGSVMFEQDGADSTRIDVQFTWDADGMLESLGSALGIDSRRVKGDLERFKERIERQGVESGSWRGEVHAGNRTS
jgi:uncharacterized membrane protein